MLGLFNKKEETPQEEHPEFIKLVEKWDTFLDKIKTRFFESLVDSEEALLDNLEESNYDINPTMVAWQGIKSQLMALMDKIENTYKENVLPQMLEYKEEYDTIEQSKKGINLQEKIYLKIQHFEILLEGKIATRFYNHAVQQLNKNFNCTQCSAKIKVRKDIFHSHYVKCDYCNTVNTFYPSDKITQIRWIVNNIAKLKSIIAWYKLQEAETKLNNYRTPSEDEDKTEYIKLFNELETAEKDFWTKYFTERSIYLPQYKETIKSDTNNKMKWFYKKRKRELNF